jgi:hypothetical protein
VVSTEEAYKRDIRSRLGELEVQIESLMAQATHSDYDEYLTDIRTKQEHAKAKLAELEEADGGGWQDIRSELDKAVSDVQNALLVATADSGEEASPAKEDR